MRIRITRSARKHRIGNGHIMAALASADAPIIDGDARTYVMPTSYRIRSVGGRHREG